MSEHTGSFQDNLLRWLLLLLIVPPLTVFGFSLVMNFIHEASFGTLALAAVALMVCFQFESAAARIAAALIVLCILPNVAGDIVRSVNPLVLVLTLAVLCAGAYGLLQRRYQQKPQPTKNQGAERTPVLPPGSENHGIYIGPPLGTDGQQGDGEDAEERH